MAGLAGWSGQLVWSVASVFVTPTTAVHSSPVPSEGHRAEHQHGALRFLVQPSGVSDGVMFLLRGTLPPINMEAELKAGVFHRVVLSYVVIVSCERALWLTSFA